MKAGGKHSAGTQRGGAAASWRSADLDVQETSCGQTRGDIPDGLVSKSEIEPLAVIGVISRLHSETP